MNRPPACPRLPDEKGNNESYWSGLSLRVKMTAVSRLVRRRATVHRNNLVPPTTAIPDNTI